MLPVRGKERGYSYQLNENHSLVGTTCQLSLRKATAFMAQELIRNKEPGGAASHIGKCY